MCIVCDLFDVIDVAANSKLDGPLNHRLVEITCVIFLMKHLLLTIQQVKRNVGLDPKAPINQKGKRTPPLLIFLISHPKERLF